MNILALDYGDKRIGVAVGNTDTSIAFARDFLENTKAVFEEIVELCKHEDIQTIIIGKPLMLEGSMSDSLEKVEIFEAHLQNILSTQIPELSVHVELVDERFSTNIAQTRLNMGLAKNKKKKSLIDSSAAQVILEGYLQKL